MDSEYKKRDQQNISVYVQSCIYMRIIMETSYSGHKILYMVLDDHCNHKWDQVLNFASAFGASFDPENETTDGGDLTEPGELAT